MASLIEKLKKRRFYPVTIGDETFRVRGLTFDESDRMDAVEKDLRTPFVLGCCLISDANEPEFTKADEEDDNTFAKRVKVGIKEMDGPTASDLCVAIGKVGSGDAEGFTKN